MNRFERHLSIPALVALACLPGHALSADAAYQAYFFSVCPTATGALAARCAQTPGGLGNLSSDSESSLNPSQSLTQNLSSVGAGRVRSAQGRAAGTDAEAATTGSSAQFGPFSLLVQGRWADYELERDPDADRERGIEGNHWGVELGFDRRISDRAVFGAILSYDTSDADFVAERAGVNFAPAASAGTIDTTGYGGTLFLAFNLATETFLEVAAGYEAQDHEFTRASVFQESTRTVAQTNVLTEADADGNVQWASLTLGRDWSSGATSFGIYGGLTYAQSTIDAYSETDRSGAGLAMRFGETKRESTQGRLGFRVDYTASRSGAVLVPTFRVEYLAELDDQLPETSASLLQDSRATQLALQGDEPESDVVNVGLGLSAILPNGLTLFGNADALVGGDLERTRIVLGFRREF